MGIDDAGKIHLTGVKAVEEPPSLVDLRNRIAAMLPHVDQPLNISYRPALADLPDQKGSRIEPGADYGPLNTFARGRIDLRKVRRMWPDI
ncbi:hypothetical protein ACTWPT_16850 [Nonomuraea sp. 3N208]|uniref:hypothetical protein n=1 Tax=Nonomuraea sp. 3N208 TaxID=3457421 RepID=UPI003FCD1DD2